MISHAREYISQIAFWIKPIQLSRSDQTIEDGSAPGNFTPRGDGLSIAHNAICQRTHRKLSLREGFRPTAQHYPRFRAIDSAKLCV
jgi:hypothetical protein